MPGFFEDAGASIGSLANAFFNKKKAPKEIPYQAPDLQAEQAKSVQGNLAAQDDIEKLLGRSNAFNQQQAIDMMEMAVPGWKGFTTSLMGEARDSLENRYSVPKEVEDNLARIAAEHGVSRGTSGAFNSFSLLRDLGVNQLNYGQQQFQNALSALSTLSGTAPRVSPMSPLSFYITPQQQIASATDTAHTNQAIAQGAENARVGAKNWNTQNLWDSLAASMTYAGGALDNFYSGGMSGMSGGGGLGANFTSKKNSSGGFTGAGYAPMGSDMGMG